MTNWNEGAKFTLSGKTFCHLKWRPVWKGTIFAYVNSTLRGGAVGVRWYRDYTGNLYANGSAGGYACHVFYLELALYRTLTIMIRWGFIREEGK